MKIDKGVNVYIAGDSRKNDEVPLKIKKVLLLWTPTAGNYPID
jgi:hypothetical protein